MAYNMSNEITTTEFSKLLSWVRRKIQELEIADPEKWILKKIPALGDKSVIDTVSMPNGEVILREYFSRVTGRF